MKENLKESIKDLILKMYTNDLTLTAKDVAFQVGTNLEYAQECIDEYHRSMVAYYDMGIAPSMSEENVFFLFSDNGVEKKLRKEGKNIYSYNSITPLESLYIKINLGYEVKLNK